MKSFGLTNVYKNISLNVEIARKIEEINIKKPIKIVLKKLINAVCNAQMHVEKLMKLRCDGVSEIQEKQIVELKNGVSIILINIRINWHKNVWITENLKMKFLRLMEVMSVHVVGKAIRAFLLLITLTMTAISFVKHSELVVALKLTRYLKIKIFLQGIKFCVLIAIGARLLTKVFVLINLKVQRLSERSRDQAIPKSGALYNRDEDIVRSSWQHEVAYQSRSQIASVTEQSKIAEYNGVILHESTRVPWGLATATGANADTALGTAAVARAIFTGAQAGVICTGRQTDAKLDATWYEELFDYGNQLGVAAGLIFGAKKSIFNSADFSTIVISSYSDNPG